METTPYKCGTPRQGRLSGDVRAYAQTLRCRWVHDDLLLSEWMHLPEKMEKSRLGEGLLFHSRRRPTSPGWGGGGYPRSPELGSGEAPF